MVGSCGRYCCGCGFAWAVLEERLDFEEVLLKFRRPAPRPLFP